MLVAVLKKSHVIVAITVAACTALCACNSVKTVTGSRSQESSKQENSTQENSTQETNTQINSSAGNQTADLKKSAQDANTIEFKSPDKESFKITHGKNGGSVLSKAGATLLVFADKQSSNGPKGVKIDNASGKLVGFTRIIDEDSIHIEDANKKELFKFKIHDKNFKLKDAAEHELYKLKAESYGLKIEEAGSQDAIYKVKVKEGKISLKDAEGNTVLFTRSDVPAAAIACFALEKLNKEQQYALAYTLMFLRL